MRKIFGAAILAAAMGFTAVAQAQYLIVGNDEKVNFSMASKCSAHLARTR
jgi:hypothetical protein